MLIRTLTLVLAILSSAPAWARDDACEPCRSESKRCLAPVNLRLQACESSADARCKGECSSRCSGSAQCERDCAERCRARAGCFASLQDEINACNAAFSRCAMAKGCRFEPKR